MAQVSFARTLDIYGNANEDGTLDKKDVAYIEQVLSGRAPETKLADANQDRRIDRADIEQVEAIIAGSETVLWLIDSAGKTVRVNQPVNRIVSISTYCSEPIRMFGDIEKVVAVQDNAKRSTVYFPRISTRPSIGGYPPDFEAVIKYRPDLLIGATSWTKHLYGKLPDAVIPVVGLSFTNPAIFQEEILKLGYLLNKKDRADHYLKTYYNRYLKLIKMRTDSIPEEDKPRVYMEYSMGKYRAYGGGQQFIEMIGGKNIFADFPHYFEVDPEAVMKRNPDIIIKQQRYHMGYMGNERDIIAHIRESIMKRPELSRVKAVKNGRVFILAEKIAYGCALPAGVAAMAKALYPDRFKDIDPQAIHQEFIDAFCPGVNFNVRTQGIFLYPPVRGTKI